jgi:2,4-dienoyl-CoA reductase-like NADH-dependent reductase (Old Yellow Enzyme family)
MSKLFEPYPLRGVTARNRVWVSPMCMYSCRDGEATDWHLVHLGSRAAGGAGLVMQEATAVSPEGRISPGDAGLWCDRQAEGWARVNRFVSGQGAVPAIQLAHAGRKAGTAVPWNRKEGTAVAEDGWQPLGPTDQPFTDQLAVPRAMGETDIRQVIDDFRDAAERAVAAGFGVVEVHAAHGYLLHQFLSPDSNTREDAYGGGLENRMRLPLAVAGAVRGAVPASMPVFVRISATDWSEGGWDLDQSVAFCKALKEAGVDLIDVSSGGGVPGVSYPTGPGYQVPLASAIRERAGIATAAVGMITDASQAEQVLTDGHADAVFIGRQMLRDPCFAQNAARDLGVEVDYVPKQYAWAL